ncbi:MAG TPA: type VI secretion system protein TssL, long form [Burkholderiales bacterium]
MSEREQGAGGAREPDAEATVALPTPGRRRGPFDPVLDRPAAAADLTALGGLNRLVEAANPILAVVPQIRHALRHPDPLALRKRLLEQVRLFERTARAAQIAEAPLLSTRLALCALLDDSAQATPWGRDWAPLLAELHGEANSDKFYTLLDGLLAAPEANVEPLEFFYVCLALGFEGRYRGGEGGRQALAQVRTRLHEALAALRAPTAPALSGCWQGAGIRARRVSDALAMWGAASVCVLVLAALYFAFSVSLGARSDPVARSLATLKPPAPAAPADAKSAAVPQLAATLADAIARREIDVADVAGAAVISLHSDELFAPGSARLNAALHPVILRVGEALDRVPGTVVVTGHTDDVPIRTARYPSNWELSTDRADSVVGLMASRLRDPSRLQAEGLADSAPVAPNDSTANRARNRRVAIILRPLP